MRPGFLTYVVLQCWGVCAVLTAVRHGTLCCRLEACTDERAPCRAGPGSRGKRKHREVSLTAVSGGAGPCDHCGRCSGPPDITSVWGARGVHARLVCCKLVTYSCS